MAVSFPLGISNAGPAAEIRHVGDEFFTSTGVQVKEFPGITMATVFETPTYSVSLIKTSAGKSFPSRLFHYEGLRYVLKGGEGLKRGIRRGIALFGRERRLYQSIKAPVGEDILLLFVNSPLFNAANNREKIPAARKRLPFKKQNIFRRAKGIPVARDRGYRWVRLFKGNRMGVALLRIKTVLSGRYHKATTQIFLVVEGAGVFTVDGRRFPADIDDVIRIPPRAVYSIKAKAARQDLLILEVSLPASTRKDTFRTPPTRKEAR